MHQCEPVRIVIAHVWPEIQAIVIIRHNVQKVGTFLDLQIPTLSAYDWQLQTSFCSINDIRKRAKPAKDTHENIDTCRWIRRRSASKILATLIICIPSIGAM